MITELDRINAAINHVLEADSFPETVTPPYLRDGVCAYPLRGGKRLRPALTMWCCGLVGGRPEQALRAAAAVELFHNWTLVHDDIIDKDESRRGLPACHVLLRHAAPPEVSETARRFEFGSNMALLAGDILHGWAQHMILQSRRDGVPPSVVLALGERLSAWVTPLLISGEALDVEFEQRLDVKPAEILEMLRLKTGVLLRFAAEAGAMIGGQVDDPSDETVRALGGFAESAGIAFQLQDDILGLFGDEKALGKPVGSDLRAGKRTLLVFEAVTRADAAAAAALTSMLGNSGLTPEDVEKAKDIVATSGALNAIQEQARRHSENAREVLAGFPQSPYRTLLEEFVDFMTSRVK